MLTKFPFRDPADMAESVTGSALWRDPYAPLSYRFRCDLTWTPASRGALVWVMMKPGLRSRPSNGACEVDATLQKCIRISKHNGFGSIVVVNLVALARKDMSGLAGALNKGVPLHRELNRRYLAGALDGADQVVAAWGGKQFDHEFGEERDIVGRCGARLLTLELEKPRHPAYHGGLELHPWTG